MLDKPRAIRAKQQQGNVGMKVCVYGAGSVGGVIAARLASGGVETSVVARGPHLDAIRKNGLRVNSTESIPVARIAASDDPSALGPQDLVVAAVKAHQLTAIVDGLKKLLRPDTPVVYAINGVPCWYFHKVGGPREGRRIERLDPGGRLWNEIGPDRAIGCVVNIGGSVPSPGVIDNPGGSRRLALGELDDKPSPRLAEIANVMRKGGLDIRIDGTIRHEMWAKLTVNMTATPLAVLTAAPQGLAMTADPAVKEIARRICDEACSIAVAYGAPRPDAANIVNGMMSGTHRPSILQDLDVGRPMEIDPQLTVPLEFAHEAGVPVPVLDMLAGLVKARARAAGLYAG
ncbi:2-dehydropantoate 2-reductase [soil metagenome]